MLPSLGLCSTPRTPHLCLSHGIPTNSIKCPRSPVFNTLLLSLTIHSLNPTEIIDNNTDTPSLFHTRLLFYFPSGFDSTMYQSLLTAILVFLLELRYALAAPTGAGKQQVAITEDSQPSTPFSSVHDTTTTIVGIAFQSTSLSSNNYVEVPLGKRVSLRKFPLFSSHYMAFQIFSILTRIANQYVPPRS